MRGTTVLTQTETAMCNLTDASPLKKLIDDTVSLYLSTRAAAPLIANHQLISSMRRQFRSFFTPPVHSIFR